MGKIPPSFSVNKYEEIFKSPIFIDQNGEWYKKVNYKDTLDLIRENIQSAASSVISVGYYLKHLNKENLFIEGGYETIWECAKEEFGITRGTASRYMDMNDFYSVNGDSPLLDEKYKDFSKGQLQELLYLPEEIRERKIESISPEETIKSIRNIVAEEKAKQEPTSKEIIAFYEHAKLSSQSNSSWKDHLQNKFGKSYTGGSNSIDYSCTPRGISINDKREITWHRYVQLLNECVPVLDAADEEADKCATSHISDQEQLPGQMEINDYPEILPNCSETKINFKALDKIIDLGNKQQGEQEIQNDPKVVSTSHQEDSGESLAHADDHCENCLHAYANDDYTCTYPGNDYCIDGDKAVYGVDCPHEHDGCNKHWCMNCVDNKHCCADCEDQCESSCGWIKDNGWMNQAPVIDNDPKKIRYVNPIPSVEDPVRVIKYPESLTREEITELKKEVTDHAEFLKIMIKSYEDGKVQENVMIRHKVVKLACELLLQHIKL